MKYNEENKPLVCMMTQSTCYKGTRKFTPKGILWHDTGANNPTLKRYVQPDDDAPNRSELLEKLGRNAYANDWNHITRQAGMNCWIGKLEDGTVTTVQTMPWNFRPWGCGKGPKGSCNDGWIQFEICLDGKNDPVYFEAVYKEACEITAYLCKMFGIDPKGTVEYKGLTVPTILCHQDSYKLGLGSDHSDIYDFFPKFGKNMETVRDDVVAILAEEGQEPVEEGQEKAQEPVEEEKSAEQAQEPVEEEKTSEKSAEIKKSYFRVRKAWADKASQIGAFTVLQNAINCVNANPGFSAFDEDGNQVYPAEPSVPPVEEPSAAFPMTTTAEPKTIWDFLMERIGNAYGVSGVMGNLYAESALIPINLQSKGNQTLSLSDSQYTEAVDNGSYTNFINDGYGYGIVQWTYSSRKKALLEYIRGKGSIGNLTLQLEFLWKDLQSYPFVLSVLKTATSIREASDEVLVHYEKPANQSQAVEEKRAAYGQRYFYQYADPTVQDSVETIAQEDEETAAQDGGETATTLTIINSNGSVNIRNGNGPSFEKITTARNGDTFPYVATAANGWHAILAGNQVGWVSGNFSSVG